MPSDDLFSSFQANPPPVGEPLSQNVSMRSGAAPSAAPDGSSGDLRLRWRDRKPSLTNVLVSARIAEGATGAAPFS